jgi:hypothetical protein
MTSMSRETTTDPAPGREVANTLRIALLVGTVFFISSGYLLLNLRYFSRNLGYDEVYFSAWVDLWDDLPVYYPHHLLLTSTSAWFQERFSEATGIANTMFVQKVKNTLVVSAGLGLFFALFYAKSRRYWLSLTIVLLIAFSGSLWHDATAHESAAIPGIIINLTVLLLLFYRTFPWPLPFIALIAALQSFAILLHQAYFLSVPAFLIIFLLTVHRKDRRLSIVRNVVRSSIYLLVVVLVSGGVYYYVGFVRLGLRMEDNPDGAQHVPFFRSIPIEGNFIRFFYLIRAREVWGGVDEDSARQAVLGYGSSFITSFRPDRIRTDGLIPEDPPASNIVVAVLGAVLASFFVFMVPVVRRYGPLLPALLFWMALGSMFVYWWEPWYIEHWLYITVLTWVILFIVAHTVIDRIPYRLPRTAVYGAFCFVMLSFAALTYRQNLETTIIPNTVPGIPAAVSPTVWNDAYLMEELYREDWSWEELQ